MESIGLTDGHGTLNAQGELLVHMLKTSRVEEVENVISAIDTNSQGEGSSCGGLDGSGSESSAKDLVLRQRVSRLRKVLKKTFGLHDTDPMPHSYLSILKAMKDGKINRRTIRSYELHYMIQFKINPPR